MSRPLICESDGVYGRKPVLLGTCLAYAPDSPVVKRYWPDSYTGK